MLCNLREHPVDIRQAELAHGVVDAVAHVRRLDHPEGPLDHVAYLIGDAVVLVVESLPLVVVLNSGEDELDGVEVGAVGLVVDDHDVERLAHLDDVVRVVHAQVVDEDGDLPLAVLLGERDEVVREVISVDSLVLNMDELLAPLVRDAGDGAHVTRWLDSNVGNGILTLVAVGFGELACLREDDLVDEDHPALVSEGRIQVLDDLLDRLVVLGTGLYAYGLDRPDGLQPYSAVFVEL